MSFTTTKFYWRRVLADQHQLTTCIPLIMNFDTEQFKVLDTNPGGTLESFNKYVDRIKLVFELAFRNNDNTPRDPTNREKKAMLLFRGGDDMKDLFEHVGKVVDTDTFDEAVTKIQNGLKSRTNSAVQRNLLFTQFHQGKKSFERWSKDVSNTAKLINYDNYDWKCAAVDAMLLQTSNSKLRERALQEEIDYEKLLKLGIAKEQSSKGAAQLEVASGQSTSTTTEVEEVRRLRDENKKLRQQTKDLQVSSELCDRCGYDNCKGGKNCYAFGQKCHNCNKKNHLAKVCKSSKTENRPPRSRRRRPVGRLSSAEESSDSDSDPLGRIVVAKLDTRTVTELKIGSPDTKTPEGLSLVADTGVAVTILNRTDWEKVRDQCRFVKTSKKFRPFGTTKVDLPVRGKAKISIQAKNGATIETLAYVVDTRKDQSLLGKFDAMRLGIVKLNPDGASEEVDIEDQIPEQSLMRVIHAKKETVPSEGIVSGGETQEEIDVNMNKIIKENSSVFSNKTGKFTGNPIKVHMKEGATPRVAPSRPIPLQYIPKLKKETNQMVNEGVLTGPLSEVPPDMYINNVVITNKKWNPEKIRVTLDCQSVNEDIHKSHEPIPTIEQLRHKLLGSDRFSILDITNCYHQFPLDEESKKLFGVRFPWGIYRYETLVQGASPASGEAQKKIREIIKPCENALNIKDDIIIHGKGKEHDKYLQEVLNILKQNGLTLRPEKCFLGQPEVKWFGYIFS